MGLDKKLLDILVCPACREKIEEKGEWLYCNRCSKRYPVREGIPVMLIEEAEDIPVGEKG